MLNVATVPHNKRKGCIAGDIWSGNLDIQRHEITGDELGAFHDFINQFVDDLCELIEDLPAESPLRRKYRLREKSERFKNCQDELELLEFENFDEVLERARSARGGGSVLVEKLLSMGKLDFALEVAVILVSNIDKVNSLNLIASELVKLGQIEKAVNIFEMSLQAAHNLTHVRKKYEKEVLRLATLAGIPLRM